MKPLLRDQDEVLVALGMWPFEDRSFADLSKEERRKVYQLREALADKIPPVRLPKTRAKKYRTVDVERAVAA